MRRIFPDFAYGEGPRAGCYWDDTVERPACTPFDGPVACDVAIIGGGFTGLSAALHLAQSGVDVAVFEANHIGWGASGRNGGFCCLGGGMAHDALLDARFGKEGRLEYRTAEKAAVGLVEALCAAHDITVDRHSKGETILAHRPSDFALLEKSAEAVEKNYGAAPELITAQDLPDHRMAGPFFGALTTPIGFGLNPQKFLMGLARAALQAGVRIYEHAPVTQITPGWTLSSLHQARADQIIIATNGYSSETLPPWLAGRYMPGQSNVIVTRPLSTAEQEKAGWTSDQMAFDTRSLLHYFRRLPNDRFLFGMRGGLGASPAAEARARQRIRRDFHMMFPAWANVEITHSWSGMVSLARDMLPFAGPIPNMAGAHAALCYHGNGVAMGTFAGKTLAEQIVNAEPVPRAMSQPLRAFPLGRWRRALMVPTYAALMALDRWP